MGRVYQLLARFCVLIWIVMPCYGQSVNNVLPVPGMIQNTTKVGAIVGYNTATIGINSLTDATANGTYKAASTNGVLVTYINPNSVDEIIASTNGTDVIPALTPDAAIITNTTIPNAGSFDGVMYTSTSLFSSNQAAWTVVNGLGTVSGGYLQTLNSNVPAFKFNGNLANAFPTNQILYVDAAGDDNKGFVGGFPYRTVTAAIRVAVSNQLILIGPGVFIETLNQSNNISSANWQIPPGVSMIGRGIGATTVVFNQGNNGPTLNLSGFSTLGNMTINGVISTSGDSNAVINCKIQATIDAAFVNFAPVATNRQLNFYTANSEYISGFDVFVVSGTVPGLTNLGIATAENCHFICDSSISGGPNARGPSVQQGARIILKSCTVTCTNFLTSSPCLTVGATNSFIDAYNCTLTCAVTNGRTPFICGYGAGGVGQITTHGFSIPQSLVSTGTNIVDNPHGSELFDTLSITTNLALPNVLPLNNTTNNGLTNYGTFYWSNFTKLYFIGSSNGVYRTNVIF